MTRNTEEKVPLGTIPPWDQEGRCFWHPAMGSFGGRRAVETEVGRSGRAPHNLKREDEILRFAIGLFSALAFLEAEDWPIRPGSQDWSLDGAGLPSYRPGAGRRSGQSQEIRHAALLYRMLCGKEPPHGGAWPSVPRRHAHFAAWNRWFAEARENEGGCGHICRDLLLKLWDIASDLATPDHPPSTWGVGIVWSPGEAWGAGLHEVKVRSASSHLAMVDWARRHAMRTVFLGEPPPYPFASLEPFVAEALGDGKAARDWMARHLEGAEPSLAEAVASLLATMEGCSGWVLWPAASLDPKSLGVLEHAGLKLQVPLVLLDRERGQSAWGLERIRLPWLTLSAEAWYIEHGKALLGQDLENLLSQIEALPAGEPRCGTSLLPLTPPDLSIPAEDWLGVSLEDRGGEIRSEASVRDGLEELASKGKLARLLVEARALKARGDPAGRGSFWEGTAYLLMGQPLQALALWEGLDAVVEMRGKLAVYRARAFERLQDLRKVQENLNAAGREKLGAADSAHAKLMQGQLLWLSGRAADAERCYEEVIHESGIQDAAAQAHCYRALTELHADRSAAALRHLERARKALPARPQPLTLFLLAHREALAHGRRGAFDEALSGFRHFRSLAASYGMRGFETWGDLECGNTLENLHRFSEAAECYRRAAEGAAGLGLEALKETARFNLATCLTALGDLTSARRIFEAAVAHTGASQNPIYSATDHYWLACVLFQLGDLPAVLEWCERGLKVLKELPAVDLRIALLNLRGEVLLATGQVRKLSSLLTNLADLSRDGEDAGDSLSALALRCAAAGKKVGTFGPGDREEAESLLPRATPSYRAQWHLLTAFGPGGSEEDDLTRAWQEARTARDAHLASRALWALAERGALPIVEPADRTWIARFLTVNKVRRPERGLVPLLTADAARPSRAGDNSHDDLALLEKASRGTKEAFEELTARLAASGGCLVRPGQPTQWWGDLKTEQRSTLIAASGSEGQWPGQGGMALGCKGQSGSWCGLFRPGPSSFTARERSLAGMWTMLLPQEKEEPMRLPSPDAHPAIGRHLLTISPAMKPVLESLARAAAYDYPVLLTGEPGVGKEACALAIHAASKRAAKKWVPANCANLTATLAASLLFGHRRGSFTGADRDHVGLVESARGSTLFLDEVGDLPVEVQPQVLRFLQDGTFLPLGETRTRESDVRLICATNRELQTAVTQGRFREDLFHRINVIWIVVPPLRRRPEDIPMLFHHFLEQAVEREGIKPLALEPAVLTRLAAYSWPGNVRELQNLVKALIVAAHGTHTIGERHLPARFLKGGSDGGPRTSLAAQLEDTERAAIAEAVAESGGNLSAAARRLAITRQSLFNKMKRLGMKRP